MATAETKFTRCPGCRTVFRVTDAQLALRDGQVRCGHCRAVFDGRAHAVSLAPRAAPQEEFDDDLARGPATVTLRSAHSLMPAPAAPREPSFAQAARAPSFDAPRPGGAAEAPAPAGAASAAGADSGAGHAAAADGDGDGDESSPGRRRLVAVLLGLAVPVLVGLLGLQALIHYRDAVAARWPATKPTLARLCQPVGCTVRPVRDIAGLSIDASDLQADPAHKGLLILNATLRNRAAVALGYPNLELTLTDASDQVVVRRALTPAEYASGALDLAAGFPANSEVVVKLFIDASATSQAGYRLWLFYP